MSKIEFNDLLGLEGLEAIDKAIEKIDKIDQVFEKFATMVENRKGTIVKSMKGIDESLETLNETMKKFDLTNEQHQKEAAQTAKKVEVQKTQYIGMSKEVKDLEKNLEALRSEQNKLNEERNQSISDQKQLIKLQTKLKSLDSEQAEEIAKVKVRISERNKAIKRAAMDSEGLISVYQKEVKRLRDLKNEYKDTALMYGKNSDEAQKLKMEVQELDATIKDIDASAGDFQRNVGNYPEVFQAIGGGANVAMTGVQGLSGAFKVLMANPIVALVAAVVGGIMFLFNAFKKTTAGAVKFEKALSAISTAIGTIIGRIGKWLSGEISLRELITETDDAIIENVKNSWALVDARRALEKATADNTKAEAELGEQIAKLEGIRDNDNNSLKDREKAAEAMTKLLVRQAEIRKATVDEEVKVARLAVAEVKDQGEERRLAEFELTKALAKQADARAEIIRATNDGERELQMIRLDRFEQELDLLLDIEDRRKMVNERQILDEKTTVRKKQELLRENVKMIEASYSKQIEAFNKWFDIQVDGNKIVEMSGEELFEYTNSLGLSERATNRLREVVMEKIAADQDNLESLRDVNKELKVQTNLTERFNNVQDKMAEDRAKSMKKMDEDIKASFVETRAKLDDEMRRLQEEWLKTDEGRRFSFINSLEKFKEGFNQIAGKVRNGLMDLTRFQNGMTEARIRKLEEEKERSIAAAGDNAAKREAIEKRYDARIETLENKQAQRRRRIAIFQKGVAAANSIIDTAAAVAKALPNIPKSIAVGILGGLKTAAILATPIPQYAEGTDFHTGGLAVVGDGGRHEVIQTPDGKLSVTPDKSTLVDLPRGAKVFDSIVAASRALGLKNSDGMVVDTSSDMKGVERRLDEVVRAVRSGRQETWGITHGKLTKTVREGNTIHQDWDSVNTF